MSIGDFGTSAMDGPRGKKNHSKLPQALPVHPVQPLFTHPHVGGGKWTEVAGSPMKRGVENKTSVEK